MKRPVVDCKPSKTRLEAQSGSFNNNIVRMMVRLAGGCVEINCMD